jgi:hypothetical protein
MLLRRNLIALLASFLIIRIALPRFPALFTEGAGALPFGMYWLAVAVYAGFVLQSLFSKEFKDGFEQKEMIVNIRKTAEECRASARILSRKLEPKAQARLNSMLKESDEIVNSFLGGDKNYLKVRVVQQSIKLTSSYIKLADMFRVRSSASNDEKISQLARRINANTSNMNNVRDSGIANELQRVIDADEKMIESLKNERLELDIIDARLQYMESTIGMLKYNIISNLESDDILNSLESDVYEAGALNDVLNERYGERREERRIRL